MSNPFEIIDVRLNNIEKLLDLLVKYPSEPKVCTDIDKKLSRKEAAEYLNVTLPTLDRYRREKRLPSYQTGRTIYFKRSEIDNALAINLKTRRA